MRLKSSLCALAIAAALLLSSLSAAFAQGIARAANQPLAAATLNAVIGTPLFEGEGVTSFYVSGLAASGATLTVEGSSDGKSPTDSTKSWFSVNAVPSTCPIVPFTTLTADQFFRIDTAALTDIRVRVSSIGTGTISVSFDAIPGATLSSASCGTSGAAGGGATSASLNAGPLSVTPPVTAGAYTANFAIGGLQTVPAFRTVGQPSALLDALSVASKSGAVTSGIAIYGFVKSPASTCTDHAAFVLSSADLPYLIPGFPITLTPVATVGTTQTTASAGAGQVPVSINNQDTVPSVNVYFCAVSVGTPTPGSTSDLIFNYAVLRD